MPSSDDVGNEELHLCHQVNPAFRYQKYLPPGASPQNFVCGGQRRKVRRMGESVRGLGGLAHRPNAEIFRNLGVLKKAFGKPGGARLPVGDAPA